jgi:hypothetical protein
MRVMSILGRGQKCVIVGGCPENIGLVVDVICRIGSHQGREDAYWIRTVSGRPFHQLWIDEELQRGSSSEAITDRHKLRPLVDPKDDVSDAWASEIKTKEIEVQN